MSTEEQQELKVVTNAVPEASTALKQMFWAMLIVLGTALGNFLTSAIPQLSQVVLAFTPDWLDPMIGPVITTGLLSVAVYLQKLGSNNTKTAVVEAAKQEPPSQLRKLYTGNEGN